MTTKEIASQTHEREPRKIRRPSSAASNAAQMKARIDRNGKIGSITQSRVECGIDPRSDKQTLTVIFPRRDGREPHHLDLSFLLDFPNLQPMFTEALQSWGTNLTPKTRISCSASLRCHFFAYLKSAWSNMLNPEDIDDELLTGFRESLLNKSERGAKALHPTTVGSALCDIRTVLSALTTGPWAYIANQIAERVPPGPAGADRKAEPTEVLGLAHLLAILEAAEHEVRAIEHRFANGAMLLAEGRLRLRDPDRVTNNTCWDYREFTTCLAAIDKAYPGVCPSMQMLKKKYPTLGRAVRSTHGLSQIDSYLYPSNRDLVPFVLLLSIATVFNPETVLSLNWSDIDFDKDQAGTPAIEIVGKKGRAERDLVRLLDPNAALSSQLSLKQTLICLQNITSRIRPHLAPEYADNLFVYVIRTSHRRAKGFGIDDERRVIPRATDQAWQGALRHFIKDNRLAIFTLRQLRPSILDLVQFMDGSLEAARKVGNHSSPVTTWTHYTSGGVRARYRERIGQVILLRERWLQTGGVIDPRRLAPSQDKGAATPGFACLDPFDSPRPNQQAGKLCRDYGGCPSCPMAAAYPTDPLCVGHYLALEVAIYRSQSTMSAKTWVERWTPVLADLAALRKLIPADVFKASSKISIHLPNVG
ncbi:hypothetical protein [Duganella sp. HH105]|uniref:hypothetical protein n=1 Tax=Duganella sp. HH105 TaxID=1781067 RepID=UPI000892D0A5|nr:hypothetical protein [Duganella sp. HH105]OEZ47064.1 hypothetical protein DUGA6_63570 [Duganella sp. HH105]OEZ63412.1 hypothetical protein DUGA6_12090 [Duganella sp. HH105]